MTQWTKKAMSRLCPGPLFADIDVSCPKYTLGHPGGLLFATQFAGHSPGEYSASASIADVLHISALVDVVFYRAITMQRAVERDHENRSNYAMCTVNPSRILPT